MSLKTQYDKYLAGTWRRTFGCDGDIDIAMDKIDKKDLVTKEINFQLTMPPQLKGIPVADEIIFGEPVNLADPNRMYMEQLRAEYASQIAEEKMSVEPKAQTVSQKLSSQKLPSLSDGSIIDIKV